MRLMTDIRSEGDVVGYTETVRVEGELGATEIVARSDTGAKRTAVDTEIAGEVGAGPITGTKTFRSSNGTSTRLLAEVTVVVGGRERTVEAKIADRSDMSYQVRLGRDVLGDMMVDVGSRVDD